MTHSPLKCAVLQLLHNNNATAVSTTTTTTASKGDEKYPALIESFCQILKLSSNTPSHVQAQECILSILQSFCDTEITLLQNFMEEGVNSERYLANALPMKEHLLLFIATIVDHLTTSENQTFDTSLPVVRILLLLTERDYCFYFVRDHLNKRTSGDGAPPFAKLLKSIEKNLSKDADDCLATLNILVQFLKISSTPEEVDGPMFVKSRSMKMGADELRALVGWKITPAEGAVEGEGEEKHSLLVIENQLKVSSSISDSNTIGVKFVIGRRS